MNGPARRRCRCRDPDPQPDGPKRLESAPARASADGTRPGRAACEQAETVRLDPRRGLSGWSAHGVETYGVTLVTEDEELAQAARELTSGQPTSYVVLRVSESIYDNSNRARSLRQLIEHQGLISRPHQDGLRSRRGRIAEN